VERGWARFVGLGSTFQKRRIFRALTDPSRFHQRRVMSPRPEAIQLVETRLVPSAGGPDGVPIGPISIGSNLRRACLSWPAFSGSVVLFWWSDRTWKSNRLLYIANQGRVGAWPESDDISRYGFSFLKGPHLTRLQAGSTRLLAPSAEHFETLAVVRSSMHQDYITSLVRFVCQRMLSSTTRARVTFREGRFNPRPFYLVVMPKAAP